MEVLVSAVGYSVVVFPEDESASLLISKGCWEILEEKLNSCELELSRVAVRPELSDFVVIHRTLKRMIEDVTDSSSVLEVRKFGDKEVLDAFLKLHAAKRKARSKVRAKEDKNGGNHQ